MKATHSMELPPHIMVVDDDSRTRDVIGDFLESHGFTVSLTANAAEARQMISRDPVDLIVLDVMMPGEDGLDFLRSLDPATRPGVIVHSALGTDMDRITGLDLGADDYLAKPCNARELIARIRAVLRRSRPAATGNGRSALLYSFNGWNLEALSRNLTNPNGQLVPLTESEWNLLSAFVTMPQRPLSREDLLARLHGEEPDPFDRAIDVQVSRLRKRLGADARLIVTVRNQGYMLACPVMRG